jgi:phospholipase/lecithinase/hemolysin
VDQLGLFLLGLGGQPADPNALYTVFGGANDILLGLLGLVPIGDLPTVVPNLSLIITALAQQGAVDFLVPNLPDLGKVPLSSAVDAVLPGFAATATAVTVQFNQDLAGALDQLESQFDVRIHRLDVFSMFNNAIANPAQFGFTNVSDGCMQPVGDLVRDVVVGGVPCANPDEFIFWDSIHPSARAHALLADAAFAAVVPSPTTLLLIAAGLLAAACYGRSPRERSRPFPSRLGPGHQALRGSRPR